MERAALEPIPTSSMPVTVPSASLPKPSAGWGPESRNQYFCYLHWHCIRCYVQGYSVYLLFLFLKFGQLICLTVRAAAWHLLLCVYIRKEAFHWNTFSQLVEERGLCPAWTLTQTLLKPAVFSVQPKTPNSAGGRFSLFNRLHLPTSGRKQKSLEVSWVYKGKEQTVHLKFPRR